MEIHSSGLLLLLHSEIVCIVLTLPEKRKEASSKTHKLSLSEKTFSHLLFVSFTWASSWYEMKFNLFESYLNIKLQLCAAFNWLLVRLECSISNADKKYVWLVPWELKNAGESISYGRQFGHRASNNVWLDKWSPIEFWLFFNLIRFIKLEWTQRDNKDTQP